MHDEYIEPTKRQRLQVVARILAAFVLYVALRIGIPHLINFISAKPPCEQLLWWRVFIIFFTLITLVIILRLFRFAIRVSVYGQIPLPGSLVFFRTRVYRGWRVKVEIYFSILIGLAILLGTYYLFTTSPVMLMFSPQAGCTGI